MDRYASLFGDAGTVRSKLQEEASALAGAAIAPAKPVVYQSQGGFGNILDLDDPMAPKQYAGLFEALEPALRGSAVHRVQPNGFPQSPGRLIRDSISMNGGTDSDLLLRGLRGHGYDALTHTGGQIVGNRDHQVLIGLDPNDVLGLGRKTPYQQWEQFNGSLRANPNGIGGPGSGGSLRAGLESVMEPFASGAQAAEGHGLSTRLRPLRESIPVFKTGGPAGPRTVGGRGTWADEAVDAAGSAHADIADKIGNLEGASIGPWWRTRPQPLARQPSSSHRRGARNSCTP